jgi:hypothetical protein
MITNAVFNISTDIMIIFLPMPVLFQSQLPLKRKLTLASVFALGSFTVSLPRVTCYVGIVTKTILDTSRLSQQILQSRVALRHRMDLLVHPRSLHGHHHREPTPYLDATTEDLRNEQFSFQKRQIVQGPDGRCTKSATVRIRESHEPNRG